jgi:hypothetical protein
MELPYGRMNCEAGRLYGSDERERLFSAAYDRFPAYQ